MNKVWMSVFVLLLSVPTVLAHDISYHEAEMQKIVDAGDPEACVTISEHELVADCFLAFARIKGDSSVCEGNPDSRDRVECAAIILSDVSLCDQLTESDFAHCRTVMAGAEKDPAVCGVIADVFYADRCLSHVAGKTGDKAICDSMQDVGSNTYHLCLSSVAQATKDVSVCETIPSTSIRRGCIRDVAEAAQDIELCERISNKESGTYYGCITRLSYALEDTSYCKRLSREKRSECKAEVSSFLKNSGSSDAQSNAGGTLAAVGGLFALLLVATGMFILTKPSTKTF